MQHISFEFFPPKGDEGQERLGGICDKLNAREPEFFSVTYGAGGSTRSNTQATVKNILEKGIDVAPHLSFGQDDEATMLSLLTEYREMGVRRLVALRGDRPSGMSASGSLVYANQLVAFIREHFDSHFHIEVAAYPEIHPEAESYQKDIYYLGEKFRAGANSAITQYFYNPEAYFYFIDQCAKQGIQAPIIPGIMPILNVESLLRFSSKCGADIPRWLQYRLNQFRDDKASLQAFGQDYCADLCRKLLDFGAPGLHFYTMNQSRATLAILDQLDPPAPAAKSATVVSLR